MNYQTREAWLMANEVSSLMRGFPISAWLGNITLLSTSEVAASARGGTTLRTAAAAVWRRGLYKPVTISVIETRAARFVFNHARRSRGGRRYASGFTDASR